MSWNAEGGRETERLKKRFGFAAEGRRNGGTREMPNFENESKPPAPLGVEDCGSYQMFPVEQLERVMNGVASLRREGHAIAVDENNGCLRVTHYLTCLACRPPSES